MLGGDQEHVLLRVCDEEVWLKVKLLAKLVKDLDRFLFVIERKDLLLFHKDQCRKFLRIGNVFFLKHELHANLVEYGNILDHNPLIEHILFVAIYLCFITAVITAVMSPIFFFLFLLIVVALALGLFLKDEQLILLLFIHYKIFASYYCNPFFVW